MSLLYICGFNLRTNLLSIRHILTATAVLLSFSLIAQSRKGKDKVIEVGETMEEYIQENHVEDIEDLVHQFLESKSFLTYLLEQGHDIDADSVSLRRKDVSIGEDLDVYVKHFTDHQNFTMIMVPVDIYPLAIYDTLLFSVLEVSDNWLYRNHFEEDMNNDEVKAKILSDENHHLLTNHMYEQVLATRSKDLTEVQIKLHESYISTQSVMVDVKDMSKEEKEKVLKNWGFIKRVLTHDINLNVEINIYIFGHDDMQIIKYSRTGSESYRITPSNIFARHHFLDK